MARICNKCGSEVIDKPPTFWDWLKAKLRLEHYEYLWCTGCKSWCFDWKEWPRGNSINTGWIQYECRGCGGVASALKDSLCGYYQVCETCARKQSLGESNMLPPGYVWLKEGSPGSGRFA